MALTRRKKEKVVETLSGAGRISSAFLFADFSGLKTKDMNELRKTIRPLGGSMQVVKKTLAARSLEGIIPESVIAHPAGIAAVWFTDPDAVPGIQAVWRFAKKSGAFKLLGGFIGELGMVDAMRLGEIGALPGMTALRGRLVWVLASPLARLARAVNVNVENLVRTIGAIKK